MYTKMGYFMKEQLVNILFKEEDAESLVLQPGTMTLEELYGGGVLATVTNADGAVKMIKRRDFHIVSGTEVVRRDRAIVCDIDGVLNYIAEHFHGTNHRQLIVMRDSAVAQWTDINKTVFAKPVESMFKMLKDYAAKGYKILFLTARGDSQRVVTEQFLDKHLDKIKYTLFMRGMTVNDIGAPEIKTTIMQAAILPYYTVEWFIEDCPKNVAAMRETCPQVPVMHILR